MRLTNHSAPQSAPLPQWMFLAAARPLDVPTGTLLCGDLFTQPGAEAPPVTESEILTASEAMRKPMDYYAHSTRTIKILERLASLNPTTLACQHGSAYRGGGAALLRELAAILEREQRAELA